MLSQRKIICSLVVNAMIFLITGIVFVSYFFTEPNALIQSGVDSLRYFTTDSNIFAALTSLLMVIADIRLLTHKANALPRWIVLLKYISTACVMLTFSLTVVFLMPFYGPFVIGGTLFIVHVTTPLMALLSLLLLENCYPLRIGEMFLPLIPMYLYGIIYYIMVVVIGEANGGWKDFYAYSRNGQFGMTKIFTTVACIVVSVLTALLYNWCVNRKKKKASHESASSEEASSPEQK